MKAEAKLVYLTALLTLPFGAQAQKEAPITFNNPSFEDVTKMAGLPAGWNDCGFPNESAPDVQPGSFQVTKAPRHGSTYLGLVVRDNETWEGVSQRVSRPLEINQCYEMSIDICRSEIYMSISQMTREPANYTTPAVLRIWGGNGYCDKRELLYESSLITHTRWLAYNIRLSPKKGSWQYIEFEAYYKTPVPFPYNGHILLDNTSSIRPVTCAMDAAGIAKKPEAKRPTPPQRTSKGVATKPDTVKKLQNKPVAKPTVPTDGKFKKGEVFQLENVYFDANKYEIKDEIEPALNELYRTLRSNPNVTIEVGGHTNNLAAEKFALELSTNRAKAVADWLIRKGIPEDRIQYKGYGSKWPIKPNYTEEGRKMNQRVEIKILNING
jgi:outer membrane protein OmpA-like peptidoglycan-associated protein